MVDFSSSTGEPVATIPFTEHTQTKGGKELEFEGGKIRKRALNLGGKRVGKNLKVGPRNGLGQLKRETFLHEEVMDVDPRDGRGLENKRAGHLHMGVTPNSQGITSQKNTGRNKIEERGKNDQMLEIKAVCAWESPTVGGGKEKFARLK